MKNMYKKIDKNCPKCNGTGKYSESYGGDAYYTSYNEYRCPCSLIKTKKFAEYIDNNSTELSKAMDGY